MILFRDRLEAGTAIARQIAPGADSLRDPIVLGIPRGGVPIGYPVADVLDCPLDVIVLRKLPLPQNDQMGFGAVTLDRKTHLNDRVVKAAGLSGDRIRSITDEVYEEVLRRDRTYRGDRPFPDLAGRSVIVTDDGLATGYTMLAALSYARSKQPHEVVAAIPVASENALDAVEAAADSVVCLHVDRGYSFAVASFYQSFPDLNDSEVVDLLGHAMAPA